MLEEVIEVSLQFAELLEVTVVVDLVVFFRLYLILKVMPQYNPGVILE